MRLDLCALLVSVFALVAVPVAATAQTQGKIPRVGILQTWPTAEFVERLAAFKSGLRALGYVEAQNILFEFRSAEGKTSEVPKLASELVGLNVDVIFAPTTVAAMAVHAKTRQIPIVIAVAADPVAARLISTLAHPGGYVTGMTTNNLDIIPKRLQLLREITGGRASRAAMLYAPGDASNVLGLHQAQDAARQLGIDLRPIGVRNEEELRGAFSSVRAEKIEMLLVSAGAVTDSHARKIAELAAASRVPALYGAPEFVEAGGLISYSASFIDNFRGAASYVDKILKGAKPADMPVEQSSKFLLVVNRKAARSLGLNIPPSLMLRVDRVIE
ncbi:MAG: ABC transporter substrate-binding protein [Betaproteobacteria bacterium]|nr:ABC transporter substrate-binding protein [Betaproteobacteria bacterium]